MARTTPATTTSTNTPTTPGTGSEFRSLAAATSMERRPHANARAALA
jgi:alcohol dehydrogenase class IV